VWYSHYGVDVHCLLLHICFWEVMRHPRVYGSIWEAVEGVIPSSDIFLKIEACYLCITGGLLLQR
jgi:hypothetical protein